MLVFIPIIWVVDHFANRKIIKILLMATDEEAQNIMQSIEAQDPARAKYIEAALRSHRKNRAGQ